MLGVLLLRDGAEGLSAFRLVRAKLRDQSGTKPRTSKPNWVHVDLEQVFSLPFGSYLGSNRGPRDREQI